MVANGPRARALAGRLRQARVDKGLTVRELEALAHIPRANISKYENGHAVPPIETVATLITAAGVKAEERDEILEIAREAHKKDWLTVGVHGLPTQLTGGMECERAAYHIIEWIPFGIPGLLQTNEYTRALKKVAGLSDDDIDVRVMVQAIRRDLVTRSKNPIRVDAYIGEGAFFTRVGSPETMVDQLHYLVQLIEKPNITVRIVPLRGDWHPGVTGPFVLYQFPDSSPVAHFEHHSSGAFVHDEHDINEYRRAIEWLNRIALSPEKSSARLIDAANKIGE